MWRKAEQTVAVITEAVGMHANQRIGRGWKRQTGKERSERMHEEYDQGGTGEGEIE